jgi:2-oxoglutarate ferredoxin oxidoreductase subunit delta
MEREELKANQDAILRRTNKSPSKTRNALHLVPKYCKGCCLCVEACPTGTLLMTEDPQNKWGVSVKIDAPEYCIGCKMCEMQCPDFSIFVNYEGVQEEAET